jgi:hypothetical protein
LLRIPKVKHYKGKIKDNSICHKKKKGGINIRRREEQESGREEGFIGGT